MFKRITALLIIAMLLAGVISLTAITASAEETEAATEAAQEATEAATADAAESPAETGDGADPAPSAKVIYFDPEGSGWEDYDTIGFHIWSIDDDAFNGYFWGETAQRGAKASDGRWYYDFDDAKLTIKDGKQYGVIFYAAKDGDVKQQTYNLIFGSECIGKTASCTGTIYENPEDSHKTTQTAFWEEGIDPAVYGPELQITSIGNVVGTACPASTTPYELFVNFLHNTLQNARIYAEKTDQQLLDDIAAALGLTRTDVENAIIENGLDVEWDRVKSSLPDDAADETTATEAAEASADVPKSPRTGYDATLIIILMIAVAAGACIASRKLRRS